MIILDATTRSLEIVLGSAVTTNQLEITAAYTDMTSTTNTSGANTTVTNSTTPVTAVAAPAANTVRKVTGLTVYNADTVSAVVTIRYNDSSTIRRPIKVTLGVGYSLCYDDVRDWYVIDAFGNEQQGVTNFFSVATQIAGLNSQSGTSYTLGLSDAGYLVQVNNASAITLTVPPNASVAFPTFTFVFFQQLGAGIITATAGSGVTLRAANGATTLAQYDVRGLLKTDTNNWTVF